MRIHIPFRTSIILCFLIYGCDDKCQDGPFTPAEVALNTVNITEQDIPNTPDATNRKGTLILYETEEHDSVTFHLFLENMAAVASASVVRYEITGFDEHRCTGKVLCSDAILLARPIPFQAPLADRKVRGTFRLYPVQHDNGLLHGLIRACSCDLVRYNELTDTEDHLRSYEITIQVQVNPQPAPPVDMRFTYCVECEE